MLIGAAGSVVRLCGDGSVFLQGTVRVDGNLIVNGDVSDQHGSLDRLRKIYNQHVHGGVQTGTSTTTPTTLADGGA